MSTYAVMLNRDAGTPGPEDWPHVCRVIAEDAEVAPPAIRMTEEELDAYMAERRPAFEAWQASQPTPAEEVPQPSFMERLNAGFNQIPKEIQGQFIDDYAIVRALVEADRLDLARQHISDLQVLPALQSIKDQILALF